MRRDNGSQGATLSVTCSLGMVSKNCFHMPSCCIFRSFTAEKITPASKNNKENENGGCVGEALVVPRSRDVLSTFPHKYFFHSG